MKMCDFRHDLTAVLPAQSPEWNPSLQRSLPHGTCLWWGCQCLKAGLKPLKLVLLWMWSPWMRWALFVSVPRPFPPQSVCLANHRGQRRSLKVAGLTQRHNSEPGCIPQMRWVECECVSSCGVCQSSWSYVWRRRKPGPETRAACFSLRWSVLRTLPGGRRRSPTSEKNHHEHPDGPPTYCPLPARPLPQCGLLAFASSDAPTVCSAPGGIIERWREDI